MSPLPRIELALRFFGVAALTAVAYTHFLDLEHKAQEGVWYMAFAFYLLIVGCLGLSIALVRADRARGEQIWVAAATLCGLAIAGYAISRIVPLPQMADHKGDWVNPVGIAALLSESALIFLAACSVARTRLRSRGPRAATRGAWVSVPALVLAVVLVAGTASPAGASPGHGDEPAPIVAPAPEPAPTTSRGDGRRDKAGGAGAKPRRGKGTDQRANATGAAHPPAVSAGSHSGVEFSPALLGGTKLFCLLFIGLSGVALLRRDPALAGSIPVLGARRRRVA